MIGLYVGTTENDKTMEGLFDADFTENEEFFRKDTLSLGYKNEAQRVIAENKKEDGMYDINNILSIAFGSDYYREVKYELTIIKDVTVVSVVYKH